MAATGLMRLPLLSTPRCWRLFTRIVSLLPWVARSATRLGQLHREGPLPVRGRRAIDHTVIGESSQDGIHVVTVHGVAVPLDGGPDFVGRDHVVRNSLGHVMLQSLVYHFAEKIREDAVRASYGRYTGGTSGAPGSACTPRRWLISL